MTVNFSTSDVGSDVAIAPDGKIVVVASIGQAIGVARLNPDGSLDNTFSNLFGGPGRVITPLGVFGAFAVAVSVQSDGKIVVGGWEVGPFVRGIGLPETLVVVRYNTDGSLDPGFIENGIDASGCSGTASKLVNVVDVRCGNNLDKVLVCRVPPGNPGNATTNCVPAPNPTRTFFKLYISGSKTQSELTVRDIAGRLIERRIVRNNVSELGASYLPGMYMIELKQAIRERSLKLVKQ